MASWVRGERTYQSSLQAIESQLKKSVSPLPSRMAQGRAAGAGLEGTYKAELSCPACVCCVSGARASVLADATGAGWPCGRVAAVVLQVPALRRGSHLVQCSAVTILKFLVSFRQGTHLLSLFWVLQIIRSVLSVDDCGRRGGGTCV